jgi:hypothetical protein
VPVRKGKAVDEPILQFFEFAHLRQDLKPISALFAELADDLVVLLPYNPQRTVALQKLLEAKDAAIRAKLYHDPTDG